MILRCTLIAAAVLAAYAAHAQTPPDAGRVLQETRLGLEAPKPAPKVDLQAPAEGAALPGGAKVTLAAVKLTGNTVFSEAALLSALGDFEGQTYDLAGLQGLARKLTDYYRAAGYPFARAVIPAQRFEGGVLEIRIVEGRYGRVQAQGERSEEAQRFLASLTPGAVIATEPLERATLILSDQPGIRITPIMRPGQEIGTGDLIVDVTREPMFHAEVGADNHGNRYTGQTRVRARVQADSPFWLGDQLLGQLLYTDEHMWQGGLSYSLPLGSSGLRGQIGYVHTYYELSKDFANLQAHGTADIASLMLSYPILRSHAANLAVGLGYQHKRLEDRQDATSTRNDKSSDLVPLTLQFDRRDAWGLTYGQAAYTAGRLKLDSILEAADIASGMHSRGHFGKWNLDLARLNTTPLDGLTLFGRLSAQWASKNLDSSESFILGGATGVRAYPNGEGAGDQGWLAQIEARYRIGQTEPFLFYDAGHVEINAKPGGITPPVTDNTRSIAGAGLGVRYASGALSLEATAAWRAHGGKPQSDTKDDNPRLWLTAGYRL
ncbi:ShlB/FhaC/HecB family hemolysin secretion/activation protein [Caldimonas manganoxidans]|uniref:ShlB/FhaC/HecB family hemolysin secretion/activation protein n=1 Tax=Caldimonas manganoxidans TaxID=196015 RepID=UPI0003827318|nr:ShlB/FhaC/HecB family hemolysin secretion/activation protein [Caldimonas manganoxidans]